MKIAQVPPLYESVPPHKYGGTERVVHYLTEELINQGHEVVLFCTGDSRTRAQQVTVCDRALRNHLSTQDPLAWHLLQIQMVFDRASEFDIIHFHNDYLHYSLSSISPYTHVTTLHGRLDQVDLQPIYQRFNNIPLVSISKNQQMPLPMANWVDTIYHGLPENLYSLGEGKGGYLGFLGRISPEKRPDRAIEIAIKAGMPLKIAAKVDLKDHDYFEQVIKPKLSHPLIEFLGEIGEEEKSSFLGNAAGLLFPIDWPEPFGMVMIEAMACGTPVIAFHCGSIPEIISPDLTGYIVHSVPEAVAAIEKISGFDRRRCRNTFLERFTAEKMAKKYVGVYQRLLGTKPHATSQYSRTETSPYAGDHTA